MASDSAASRSAKILRYYLRGSAPDGTQYFRRLGVTVRDGTVYKGSGLRNDELGGLAGASAGVLETRPDGPPLAGMMTYELTGVRPKLGTVFVDGGGAAPGRKEINIRQGRLAGQDTVWAQVLEEINHFNRMADAARGGAQARHAE